MKWEYRRIPTWDMREFEKAGEQGFELVAIVHIPAVPQGASESINGYFKRPYTEFIQSRMAEKGSGMPNGSGAHI